MSTNEVFKTLSAVNANDFKEKKGKFDYLSWTDAWQLLMEHYPGATHDMLEDVHYEDGTMEVRSSVTIDGQTQKMFLPVIDHRNNAIKNPNAFDINKNRMRCLVKNIALFGLGIYIFKGEDFPAPPADLQEKYDTLVSLVAKKLHWELRKFYEDNAANMDELFNMAPHGKKGTFKDDVRKVYGESSKSLKASIAVLEDAVGNPDTSYSVTETLNELLPLEQVFVLGGLSETVRSLVNEQFEKGE